MALRDAREAQRLMLDFKAFLLKSHRSDLENLLLHSNKNDHVSILCHFGEIVDQMPSAAAGILDTPIKAIPLLRNSLIQAQRQVLAECTAHEGRSVKVLCHVRLYRLPRLPGYFVESVSALRASDAGKLMTVLGTVTRTGAVRLLEYERMYQCTKCSYQFRVITSLDANHNFELPAQCPSIPDPSRKKCKNIRFEAVEGERVCKDYQEIRIQERVQSLDMGSVPRAIKGVLYDDLTDAVKAGDDVVLTGILRNVWDKSVLYADSRCTLDLVFDVLQAETAASLEAKSEAVQDPNDNELVHKWEEQWIREQASPLGLRDRFIRSFCPELHGLYIPKLAVLLSVIGGVDCTEEHSNTRVRGQSHILMVGDPGTGKSHLLGGAAKLSNRSVFTTGIGSTSAGLTVTAVRDAGEWALEAGALVLADGGVCCIDEFGSIRSQDRAAIHEAMEQQTLSVAKAGLVVTLNTRASVVAAMNPKGDFNPELDISENCAIASPLLSRFDLILVMLDAKQEEWDSSVADHILHRQVKQPGHQRRVFCSMEEMKQYVRYIKARFQPKLTTTSREVLVRYYQLQRQQRSRSASRTTIRLLESLIRVSQAHARLMFRDRVLLQDSIFAIILIETSFHDSALLKTPSVMEARFSSIPDALYTSQVEVILKKLGFDAVEEPYCYRSNIEKQRSSHKRV